MPKTTTDFKNVPTQNRVVSLHVTIPTDLYKKVDEYRWLNRLNLSRTVAELLALGLVGHKREAKKNANG